MWSIKLKNQMIKPHQATIPTLWRLWRMISSISKKIKIQNSNIRGSKIFKKKKKSQHTRYISELLLNNFQKKKKKKIEMQRRRMRMANDDEL